MNPINTELAANPDREFTEIETDRIIEMAWEDRTPFDAIYFQFGLTEDRVKAL
jgi:hypothetical protein